MKGIMLLLLDESGFKGKRSAALLKRPTVMKVKVGSVKFAKSLWLMKQLQSKASQHVGDTSRGAVFVIVVDEESCTPLDVF